MANADHVRILEQGVEAWNAWRDDKYPGTRPSLRGTDLRGTDLRGADLRGANLRGANLNGTDLSNADLNGTDLSNANLNGTDLSNATLIETSLGNLDLSETKGLETIRHRGPSTIGTDTLHQSAGKIPDIFLKGCGMPQTHIDYLPSLLTPNAIDFYSCFISCSHDDQSYAQRLHDQLQARGFHLLQPRRPKLRPKAPRSAPGARHPVLAR